MRELGGEYGIQESGVRSQEEDGRRNTEYRRRESGLSRHSFSGGGSQEMRRCDDEGNIMDHG